MGKLTVGQLDWLEFVDTSPHKMTSRLVIGSVADPAVRALVKRGLLEWYTPSLLRITDAGRAALRKEPSAPGEG